MKKRLVFVLFSFLFLLGSAGLDAKTVEELIVVMGKDGDYGLLVSPPSEYIDSKGNLTAPIQLSIVDAQSGNMVFSTVSYGSLIYLKPIKQGDYVVSVSIGSFAFEQAIAL